MLRRHWGMLATAAIFATGSAGAQTAGDTRQIDRLEGQIQALQREVGDLKEKALTAEKNTYAAAPAPGGAAKTPVAAPTAIATMSPNYRPSICTPDQQNCISLTGVLQVDLGGYNYRPATGRGIAATGVPIAPSTVPQQLDDGVNVRRGRIGVLGKFMGDWNYALIYDFGNSSDGFGGLAPGSLPGGGISGLENAYLSYTGFKPFAIEGGYMVVPYTLDQSTSSNDIMFLERASSQVIAANIAAGDFRSAGGIRGYNDWVWAGGYFTGPVSGTIHTDTTSVTTLVTVPAGCTTPSGTTKCSAATPRQRDHRRRLRAIRKHRATDFPGAAGSGLFAPPRRRRRSAAQSAGRPGDDGGGRQADAHAERSPRAAHRSGGAPEHRSDRQRVQCRGLQRRGRRGLGAAVLPGRVFLVQGQSRGSGQRGTRAPLVGAELQRRLRRGELDHHRRKPRLHPRDRSLQRDQTAKSGQCRRHRMGCMGTRRPLQRDEPQRSSWARWPASPAASRPSTPPG